jgi:hypothetical protein
MVSLIEREAGPVTFEPRHPVEMDVEGILKRYLAVHQHQIDPLSHHHGPPEALSDPHIPHEHPCPLLGSRSAR